MKQFEIAVMLRGIRTIAYGIRQLLLLRCKLNVHGEGNLNAPQPVLERAATETEDAT